MFPFRIVLLDWLFDACDTHAHCIYDVRTEYGVNNWELIDET